MSISQIPQQIIRARYGPRATLEAMPGGRNPVFRVTTPAGVRILKIARNADDAVVRKELWLMDLLAGQDVPLARIEHSDPGGDEFGRAYLLMHSAGDETVADWLTRGGAAPAHLTERMGALLGRVHRVEFAGSGDLVAGGLRPADPGVFLAKLHQVGRVLAEKGLLAAADVDRFVALDLPRGDGRSLCHSDFQPGQCIVRGGEITAVVDWESAWAGDPGIDLAIAHAHLELVVPGPLTEAFLAGYGQEHALPGDYPQAYLQVRMGCLLGLIRVWAAQGGRSFAHAMRHQRVQRALTLFRDHARRLPA